MLHDAGLPQKLWAEAFSTATYLRNRTPTRVLDGLTPFELLYGVKPDLADLRAFGAPCAIAEPSAKLKKLPGFAFLSGISTGVAVIVSGTQNGRWWLSRGT